MGKKLKKKIQDMNASFNTKTASQQMGDKRKTLRQNPKRKKTHPRTVPVSPDPIQYPYIEDDGSHVSKPINARMVLTMLGIPMT